jgi:hypothetical protein
MYQEKIPFCVGVAVSLTAVLADWTEMVLLVCVKAGVGVTGGKCHILDMTNKNK